jgi:hypothetical protein
LIIRSVIALGLTLTVTVASLSAQDAGQPRDRVVGVVPCASCVVFELIAPDSLAAEAVEALGSAGARIAVPLRPDGPIPASPRVSIVVIGPGDEATADASVFAARTLVTRVRSARPSLVIVLDGDAFAAAQIPVEPLRPYVDAVAGGAEGWRRVARIEHPTVDDLVRLSLTTGVDRIIVPLGEVDAGVLLAFAARAAVPVDVGATRRLTAEEITARRGG